MPLSASGLRVRAYRARQRGLPTAPLKQNPGRPVLKKALAASLAKRNYRRQNTATEMLKKLLVQLLRVRIIAKHTLESATNVRRMLRLAHRLQVVGISKAGLCMMLLVDRTLRDARLSVSMYCAYLRLRTVTVAESQAVWQSIQSAVRRHRKLGGRSAFWPGPSALVCADVIAQLRRSTLENVARKMTEAESISTEAMMSLLTTMPCMGAYHAYDSLRALRVVLGFKLLGERETSAKMSANVAMLMPLLSSAEVKKIVRKHGVVAVTRVNDGDAALVLCEIKKALTTLGLFRAGKKYSHGELVERLSSQNANRLLYAMQECEPLSEADLTANVWKKHAEHGQLERSLPAVAAPWDRSPHYAVGSEFLAARFLKVLQRRGWNSH